MKVNLWRSRVELISRTTQNPSPGYCLFYLGKDKRYSYYFETYGKSMLRFFKANKANGTPFKRTGYVYDKELPANVFVAYCELKLKGLID